jgi:F-type H+-transporting ATPase subunit b
MDINMSLLGQMITFAVLVWVSMKFVFPSLNAALDERAKRIADGLAAADQGQQAMVAAEKRAGEALAGAREEASQRVADAEKRAQLVAKKSKRMHKLKQTASLRKLKPKPSSNWPRRAKRCALRWLTWL